MSRQLHFETVKWSAVAGIALALGACGGGGDDQTFTVGGNVTGLNAGASVVLQNNGGDSLTVSGNNSFTFATAVKGGNAYAVTVSTQPTGQTCTVASGTGQNLSANVSNVAVTCTTNKFTVGGNVAGLNAGASVVLQNNGGDNRTVAANGNFTFATSLNFGSAYAVTVSTQPTGQTCAVANGTGQNLAANVTNVAVTCTTNQYTISATVTGLTGDIVLQNNAANNVSRSGNGALTFAPTVTHGTAYNVTVLTKPADQTCTAGGNAAGNATADVNVAVTCAPNPNTIGGNLAGLGAGTIVIQNNLGDNLSLSGAGSQPFTFQTPVPNDGKYFVSILSQPVAQTCTVAAGSGTAIAPVTNVQITCVNNPATFALGFTVTGLNGSVTLRTQQRMGVNLLGTQDKTINADGAYTFDTPLTNDIGFFDVAVLTQPAGQRCVVFHNLQIAVTALMTNVRVVCTNGTEEHSFGGTITGLNAAGLILLADVNGTFVLPPAGATSFTLPRKLTPDTPINMALLVQPAGQTCIITNNQDTMGTADIAPVRIDCVNNVTSPLVGTYAVSDTNGLAGGNRFFLTLYPDGVYMMATRQDDPGCGQSNGNGVELGAYNYNSGTGAVSIISNVLDTNGDCGFWDGSPSDPVTLQKTGVGQGTVLTFSTPESTFTLTPVPSIPNTLVGSFRLPFVYDIFMADEEGHYTITTTNVTPVSNEVGLEYGCLDVTGTTSGTFTAQSAPAVCPEFVDTNDDTGFFGPGETAPVSLPYTIATPYLIRVDNGDPDPVTVGRVVPN
jgi:hypothetical protein